jgi:glycosyltransferase involved in cell wall biosynthesis
VIHNAVDFEKYKYSDENRTDIRAELGIDKSTMVLGNIGRITLQKNSLFQVRVLSETVKKNPNVRLLIVGKPEGDFGGKFDAEVEKLGMKDFVICVGEKKDAHRYYSAMDVFIMPSLYEGLSFTAIEAQVSGIRCLFSDTMVPETKIVSQTKFLSINNPEEWAEEVLKYRNDYERLEGIKEQIVKAGYDIETQAQSLKLEYKGDEK